VLLAGTMGGWTGAWYARAAGVWYAGAVGAWYARAAGATEGPDDGGGGMKNLDGL
jgi:hypothetical protein